ncbi:MAG TPA: hypothetical protein PKV96_02905 [Candidatus Saccharimonas sp.]|nr:hypothetical protein [Candidatus Saccharimonas sp.]
MRSRNEKGSAGVVIATLVALVLVYLAGFVWEYNTIAPWLGDHHSWSDGLFHGMFIWLNFVVNLFSGHSSLPLYATGGSGWYNFWYLFGVSTVFSGSSSLRRRRD